MAGSETRNFLACTRAAKKVMVLDLGFLGDTVHLLPALWMIRQAYPQAELHAAVSAHITSFMDCVPWVNRVWGYMRYPRHATLRENWQMIRCLRKEEFDVVINLNGSDRSSWLTFLSGARKRLGRIPEDGGPLFWRHMFTDYVRHPSDGEPVYMQRCHCLEKAGFPFAPPGFHVEISRENLQAADIAESETGTYFHISPFTTANYKELAPAQLAEFLNGLSRDFPGKKLALSCAPTEREEEKMTELLGLLTQKPWRVFAGNLNLLQLTAVIKHSALHFCGDTGTLHLAVAAQTPVITWFWPNPGIKIWLPTGGRYRVIVGVNETGTNYLGGVDTAELLLSTRTLLAGGETEKMSAI
ncbi:MAG: glycosyltransferase family 9 protein [Verrucomicrobiota bacterium]|jgi:heptosyltransferase-3